MGRVFEALLDADDEEEGAREHQVPVQIRPRVGEVWKLGHGEDVVVTDTDLWGRWYEYYTLRGPDIRKGKFDHNTVLDNTTRKV